MALGSFTAIPNTAKLNGTTSDRATIATWNGLAAGPHSWYAALNGGHGAMENKAIALDLSKDVPQWTLLNAGTSPSNYTSGMYYADGLPAARHTYFQTQVISSRNRVMAFGGYAVNASAAATSHVDGFDLSTNTWDAAGTWQDSPLTMPGVLSVAKDPRTDDVYVAGYGKFAKWRALDATWQSFTPLRTPASWNSSWEFKGSCIDTKRNRWVSWNGVMINSAVVPTLNMIDLSNLDGWYEPITGAYSGSADNYAGCVHDLDNDRYLVIKGTTLFAVDPNTYVSTAVATVPAGENGVQSRLAYFQELGGVAYLPTFESNVLFMPTR